MNSQTHVSIGGHSRIILFMDSDQHPRPHKILRPLDRSSNLCYLQCIFLPGNGFRLCDIEIRGLFGCAFFCIFVRNTIYVCEIEVLGPALLSRKHTLLNDPFSCYNFNKFAFFDFGRTTVCGIRHKF